MIVNKVRAVVGRRAGGEPGRYTRWLPSSLAVVALSFLTLPTTAQSSDEQQCSAFVAIGENHKRAHEEQHCLRAAEAGSGSAQYALGMGYGFADDSELEQKYYRLAADRQVIASYLALGHVLAESRPWEAIYWYQRYIAAKGDGYGYATLLVSRIFERLGDTGQAAYWLEVCRTTRYEGCTQ